MTRQAVVGHRFPECGVGDERPDALGDAAAPLRRWQRLQWQ